MALSSAQHENHFKVIGKLIYLSQQSTPDSDNYKTVNNNVYDQVTTVAETPELGHAVINDVLVALNSSVNSVVNSVNTVPAAAKAAVDRYLQQRYGVDLGLAAGQPVGTVIDALITDMNVNDVDVAPSGTGGSNSTGYAMYFANNYSKVLPQDASPEILDAWIAEAVQAAS